VRGKRQRLLLARDVLPAWGEPARPGFPPEGETGKREIQKSSSLPQAFVLPRVPNIVVVRRTFFVATI